jgi:hypothetical protein
VKQLFLIFALLIQSFGFLSADAKLAASSNTYFSKENSACSSVNLNDDEAGIIHRTLKLSGTSLKIRVARSFVSSPGIANGVDIFSVLHFQETTGYKPPFYLPLVRLLLFPKHYFW